MSSCRPLLLAVVPALALAACGRPETASRPSAEVVFDAVAPSVVAISNDDSQEREEQIKALEKHTFDTKAQGRYLVGALAASGSDTDRWLQDMRHAPPAGH